MVGVSYFSETLLEAVEDELTVSALSYVRTRLNSSLLVLDRQVNSQGWSLHQLRRRALPSKLPLPRKLPISLPHPGCPPARQGSKPTPHLVQLDKPSL